MSCILVLYLALCAAGLPPSREASASTGPGGQAATAAGDPDALYARRDNLASARQAAAIWESRLKQNPKDFESAWKLARALYWLGGHASDAERNSPELRRASEASRAAAPGGGAPGALSKALLEQGIAAGRTAVSLQPNRPEGHFWIAANMGTLAESFGLRQGLKYRGDIRDELLLVLKLDPAFQKGSADRALGRWYYKVPGLFGGSRKKSEEHLRKSLTYDPHSTASHYFLAEMLIADGRKDEARAELQKVIDAPFDPEWTPEDREFKQKAQRLLATLR
jgi:tetratricopeptide (TPR) repeat protein